MKTRRIMRQKRRERIRAKGKGSSKQPRLSVFRSHTGFTAQVIDDDAGKTIVGIRVTGKNQEIAKKLGAEIAKLCKEKGISRVIFDRGGFRYHGTIQALADGAREGGLTF